MDYRYLKAFSATARYLSFKKAAFDLRVSPSAITRQIALLEESVGGELFIRGNKRVILTELGSRLALDVQRFQERVGSLKAEPPLRIGCLQSVFEFFLVDVMRRNPKSFIGALDIEIDSPENLQAKIELGQLDLIITNRAADEITMLSGFRLFQENLHWVGSGSRDIVFTAFESHYSEKSLRAPDRIRINSFNGALALTNRGLGKALFAYPTKKPGAGTKPTRQWIYAVAPNYKRAPARLKEILRVLKDV